MSIVHFFRRLFKKKEFEPIGPGIVAKIAHSMPKEMPEDIQISYSQSAGMDMRGLRISINQYHSHIYFYHHLYQTGYQFTLTAEERKELYKVLRDNKLHAIETNDYTVLDKGSETITLQWADQIVETGSNAAHVIKDKHMGAFLNCVGAIKQLGYRDHQRNLKAVKLVLAEELVANKVRFSLETEELLYKTTLFSTYSDSDKKYIQLLKGVQRIEMSIDTPYSQKTIFLVPVLDNQETTIKLYWDGDKVKWEVIIN